MLSIGTIIEGTHIQREIIAACLEAADRELSEAPGSITEDGTDLEDAINDYDMLIDDLIPPAALNENGHPFWGSDRSFEAMAVVEHLMQELCPPYTYFGTLEGDGACFGVWADIERLEEEARFGGEVLKVSDLSELDDPDGPLKRDSEYTHVMHVNDHGNVTLYALSWKPKLTEQWAVV